IFVETDFTRNVFLCGNRQLGALPASSVPSARGCNRSKEDSTPEKKRGKYVLRLVAPTNNSRKRRLHGQREEHRARQPCEPSEHGPRIELLRFVSHRCSSAAERASSAAPRSGVRWSDLLALLRFKDLPRLRLPRPTRRVRGALASVVE